MFVSNVVRYLGQWSVSACLSARAEHMQTQSYNIFRTYAKTNRWQQAAVNELISQKDNDLVEVNKSMSQLRDVGADLSVGPSSSHVLVQRQRVNKSPSPRHHLKLP